MRSGDPMAMSQAATDRFNKLSSDLALGHVRGDARIGWHVVDNDLDDVRQRQLLEAALVTNRIPEVLNGLLPTHPQYGALQDGAVDRSADRSRRRSTRSGSTWTAGAGCRATLARNISSSTCRRSMRRWSKMA